jgi:hypothetical protein
MTAGRALVSLGADWHFHDLLSQFYPTRHFRQLFSGARIFRLASRIWLEREGASQWGQASVDSVWVSDIAVFQPKQGPQLATAINQNYTV